MASTVWYIVSVSQNLRNSSLEGCNYEFHVGMECHIQCIGDGVITTDIRGKVVFMNGVAERLTGWNNADAFGQPLADVFHIINEFTRKICENPVEKVLKTGVIVELANHTMLISRDGREMILADSGSPIRDECGNVFGVVLVFRDVTEKQKMLDTLQQTQKLDSLGVLAGGIAHDFNNLLGGIFGYIDLARMNRNLDTTVLEYLDNAMSVLSRAKNLTQQLLTFSKGGAPVRKSGSVGKVVKTCSLFALSGSNVTCRFVIDEDLPSCEFDENQLCQVIDNIVLNAQQSMPMGGSIEVTVRSLRMRTGQHLILHEGEYVKIAVQDKGIGIPKEIMPRIFDPFFTTKSKGHGLGLATSYSIMRKHDGCIDVESEPGQGSTFTIYRRRRTWFVVGRQYRLGVEFIGAQGGQSGSGLY
jgi:two-component system cell cycle sensor histidine kinase/response regulator CckA